MVVWYLCGVFGEMEKATREIQAKAEELSNFLTRSHLLAEGDAPYIIGTYENGVERFIVVVGGTKIPISLSEQAFDNGEDDIFWARTLEVMVFENPRLEKPRKWCNVAQDFVPLTPQECRATRKDYMGEVTADLAFYRVDPLHPRDESRYVLRHRAENRAVVAVLPVLVGSKYCVTDGMTNEQRLAIGECPSDAKQYYIYNGNEYAILGQEKMRVNTPHTFHEKDTSTLQMTCTTMCGAPTRFQISTARKQTSKNAPKTNDGISTEIMVSLICFDNPINIAVLIRLLGIDSLQNFFKIARSIYDPKNDLQHRRLRKMETFLSSSLFSAFEGARIQEQIKSTMPASLKKSTTMDDETMGDDDDDVDDDDDARPTPRRTPRQTPRQTPRRHFGNSNNNNSDLSPEQQVYQALSKTTRTKYPILGETRMMNPDRFRAEVRRVVAEHLFSQCSLMEDVMPDLDPRMFPFERDVPSPIRVKGTMVISFLLRFCEMYLGFRTPDLRDKWSSKRMEVNGKSMEMLSVRMWSAGVEKMIFTAGDLLPGSENQKKRIERKVQAELKKEKAVKERKAKADNSKAAKSAFQLSNPNLLSSNLLTRPLMSTASSSSSVLSNNGENGENAAAAVIAKVTKEDEVEMSSGANASMKKKLEERAVHIYNSMAAAFREAEATHNTERLSRLYNEYIELLKIKETVAMEEFLNGWRFVFRTGAVELRSKRQDMRELNKKKFVERTNRNSGQATLAQASILTVRSDKHSQSKEPRYVQETQMNFGCPSRTPDSEDVGLRKNGSLMVSISEPHLYRHDIENLIRLLRIQYFNGDFHPLSCEEQDAPVVRHRLSSPGPRERVFINGCFIGWGDAIAIRKWMLRMKREQRLWQDCLVYIDHDGQVQIFSDDGRQIRPLLTLDETDGLPILFKLRDPDDARRPLLIEHATFEKMSLAEFQKHLDTIDMVHFWTTVKTSGAISFVDPLEIDANYFARDEKTGNLITGGATWKRYVQEEKARPDVEILNGGVECDDALLETPPLPNDFGLLVAPSVWEMRDARVKLAELAMAIRIFRWLLEWKGGDLAFTSPLRLRSEMIKHVQSYVKRDPVMKNHYGDIRLEDLQPSEIPDLGMMVPSLGNGLAEFIRNGNSLSRPRADIEKETRDTIFTALRTARETYLMNWWRCRYTHCEVDPLALFCITTSLIPFAQHNQGPRIQLGVKFNEQGNSMYHVNQFGRMDNLARSMVFPVRPIFKTPGNQATGIHNLPGGFMVNVAFTPYFGTSQEDSLQYNRDLIDAGMLDSYYWYTVSLSEAFEDVDGQVLPIQKNKKKKHQLIFGIPPERCYDTSILSQGQQLGNGGGDDPAIQNGMEIWKGKFNDISKLGLPRPGTFVKKGDRLIAAYSLGPDGVVVERSVYVKAGREGVIERVAMSKNSMGIVVVDVRVRRLLTPLLGDKFATDAQKGTIGQFFSREDVLFTTSGQRVDMIINPHCQVSRMTTGKPREVVMNKAALLTGQPYDATAFRSSDLAKASDTLVKNGFMANGCEWLISGRTGQFIAVPVFTGPLYYQQLRHFVRDKIQGRASHTDGPNEPVIRQPVGGSSRRGGLRLGAMEGMLLGQHGCEGMQRRRYCHDSDAFETALCENCGQLVSTEKTDGSGELECYVCVRRSEMKAWQMLSLMQKLPCIGLDMVSDMIMYLKFVLFGHYQDTDVLKDRVHRVLRRDRIERLVQLIPSMSLVLFRYLITKAMYPAALVAQSELQLGLAEAHHQVAPDAMAEVIRQIQAMAKEASSLIASEHAKHRRNGRVLRHHDIFNDDSMDETILAQIWQEPFTAIPTAKIQNVILPCTTIYFKNLMHAMNFDFNLIPKHI